MKKIVFIFIFIFLTGIFSGLFFSTNLSDENNSYLSELLLASFTESSYGFSQVFFSSLLSNFTLVLLMLAALLTKYLCPLPPLLLWYKSFAIGFCSGLVYINASADAFLISLLKIFPQNVLFIPAFTALAATLFFFSLSQSVLPELSRRSHRKKNRISQQNKILLYILALSSGLIILGSFTEAIFHAIAL